MSPATASDGRLVDAVLLPGFTGEGIPDWLARAADGGLAGVCVFAPNVGGDFPALTRALHGRRPGFLVASDEEGGAVTRLEHRAGSSWPGAAALGRRDDVAVTTAVAAAMGAQCRAAGIDLALAPVADVNAEPENPVIGIRSFGATPDLVARHTAAFVRGMQGAGVAAAAKHYPGHGSTTVDSHRALPVVDADLATLRARDLPPFAAAVAAGVRAVLTAHVRFPALDDRPATMSPALLGLLRTELGFDGVVISDALDMHAISRGAGRGPGAVAAVGAGVDLVCTGNPAYPEPYDDEAGYREVRDALLAALADGTLARERVAEAGRRVAELASWVDAAAPWTPAVDTGLGAEVVARVVDVVGDVRIGPGAHVLDLSGAENVAAGRRREPWLVAALRRTDPAVTVGQAAPPDRPLVAVVTGPSAALDAVRAARPDAVAVHVGLPGAWTPPAPSLTVWGDGRAHAEVAARLLTGTPAVTTALPAESSGRMGGFPGCPQFTFRVRVHSDGMSDETRELGRDASASTDGSRTDQHPVTSEAAQGPVAPDGPAAPTHPGLHPASNAAPNAGPNAGPNAAPNPGAPQQGGYQFPPPGGAFPPPGGTYPPPNGPYGGPPAHAAGRPRMPRSGVGIVVAALLAGILGAGAGFGGAYALLEHGGPQTVLALLGVLVWRGERPARIRRGRGADGHTEHRRHPRHPAAGHRGGQWRDPHRRRRRPDQQPRRRGQHRADRGDPRRRQRAPGHRRRHRAEL